MAAHLFICSACDFQTFIPQHRIVSTALRSCERSLQLCGHRVGLFGGSVCVHHHHSAFVFQHTARQSDPRLRLRVQVGHQRLLCQQSLINHLLGCRRQVDRECGAAVGVGYEINRALM